MKPSFIGSFSLYASDTLYVLWTITKACNYRCPYCCVEHAGRYMDMPLCQKVADFIVKQPHKYKEVTLFGGEVTTHPHLVELVRLLCGSRIDVELFTNFGCQSQKLQELAVLGATFVTSYHPSQTSRETFESKLCLLAPFITHVNVMFDLAYREDVDYMLAVCRELQLSHELAPICQNGVTAGLVSACGYNKQHVSTNNALTDVCTGKSWKKFTQAELDLLHWDNCEGYTCLAGERYLCIDEAGEIFPCKRAEQEKNSLGNVSEDVSLGRTSCHYKTCLCDGFVPRWKG